MNLAGWLCFSKNRNHHFSQRPKFVIAERKTSIHLCKVKRNDALFQWKRRPVLDMFMGSIQTHPGGKLPKQVEAIFRLRLESTT